MKKIIVVFVLLVSMIALPVMGMTKADMMKVISKIRKDNNKTPTTVIVAGVRGSDVQKQDANQLRKDLYWEE